MADKDFKDIKIGKIEPVTQAEVKSEKEQVPKYKGKSFASWKPASILEIPKKFQDPNFVYYCADHKRPGRVMQKLNEGWEVDKYIVPKMRKSGHLPEMPASLQDGLPKDDTLQFRELIVLRMPKELAKKREEYYANQDPLKMKIEREEADLDDKMGGRSYGDIKI